MWFFFHMTLVDYALTFEVWVEFGPSEIFNVSNSVILLYGPALLDAIIVKTAESALTLNQEDWGNILSVQ